MEVGYFYDLYLREYSITAKKEMEIFDNRGYQKLKLRTPLKEDIAYIYKNR